MQRRAALRSIGVPLLLFGVACGPKKEAPVPPPPPQSVAEVGRRAPAFTRRPIALYEKGSNAVPVVVPSDDGRVTVVIFWATWSEPDMVLLTAMEELSRMHGDRLHVVGVSVDETDEHLVEVAKARGVTFPIVWDQNHEIAQRYRPETDPALYILDKEGIISFLHFGYHDREDERIDDEILSLLGVDPCSQPKRMSHLRLCGRKCDRSKCVRDNTVRNEALATCSRPRPRKREACEAYCASEAFGQAYDTCKRQSAGDQALEDECVRRCGVGPCREQCRQPR